MENKKRALFRKKKIQQDMKIKFITQKMKKIIKKTWNFKPTTTTKRTWIQYIYILCDHSFWKSPFKKQKYFNDVMNLFCKFSGESVFFSLNKFFLYS